MVKDKAEVKGALKWNIVNNCINPLGRPRKIEK